MSHRAILFALAVSVLPSSAFACGMYIPPEKEVLLTDLFEEIDEVPTVVEQPSIAQIAEATEVNAQHDVVTDDSRPHRKLFDRLRRRD